MPTQWAKPRNNYELQDFGIGTSRPRRSTELHELCRHNDFAQTRRLLETSLASAGIEKVKAMLFAEDEARLTPIHLACESAGESDTGDARVRLLLLGYLV